MPAVNIQGSLKELTDQDSRRAIRAIGAVLLEEINKIRAQVGMQPQTAQALLVEFIAAYKNS